MQKSDDGVSIYPRVYRTEGNAKLAYNALGIIMSALAIAALSSLLGQKHESISRVLPVAPFAFFGFWFLYLANQRIILYEDAIEKVTWFSRRKLKREDIRGWYGKSDRGSTYILVAREGRFANLLLRPLWRRDEVFYEWMKAIPHINE